MKKLVTITKGYTQRLKSAAEEMEKEVEVILKQKPTAAAGIWAAGVPDSVTTFEKIH